MSTRKRPAAELLPLHRSPKVQRTSLYPTFDSRSSQDESYKARWVSFGREFCTLAVDTFQHVFQSSVSSIVDSKIIKQPLPRSSLQRSSSVPTRPRISLSSRGEMGPPPVPRPPVASSSSTTSESCTSVAEGTNSSTQPTSSHTSQPSTPSSSYPEIDAAIAQSQIRHAARVKPRQHIFAKQHKAQVIESRQKDREEMMKELYDYRRAQGYSSDYNTFKEYLKYQQKVNFSRRDILSPSSSLQDLRSRQHSPTQSRSTSLSRVPRLDDVETDFLERALQNARATLNEPKPPRPFAPTLEQLRLITRSKDAAIDQRLRPKRPPVPSALPPADEAQVDELMKKRGVISKFAREQVSDKDLSRLLPSQWLNDELINFYGAMLLARSEKAKENAKNGKSTLPDVHYFSTFFWQKLTTDGYEAGRLAKWTKKIDIFAKDLIIIPINHHNAHWTAAAINFRKKRIESYDSMDGRHPHLFKTLRGYLDAEHRSKKKQPFDFTGWQDYRLEDTPQQENHFDCGVFSCQFMESLSRGEETFNFTQSDMKYLRRRMAWEIGNARLRDD